MQPNDAKNRFEDTYGQVRPSKPHQDEQASSSDPRFSSQDSTHTQKAASKGPWYQLGVTLLLVFLGAAALIIGGFFAIVSLAVGVCLLILKRLFLGGTSGSSITPRRR